MLSVNVSPLNSCIVPDRMRLVASTSVKPTHAPHFHLTPNAVIVLFVEALRRVVTLGLHIILEFDEALSMYT